MTAHIWDDNPIAGWPFPVQVYPATPTTSAASPSPAPSRSPEEGEPS